ncbi:hypothetical protein DENSPDRAFT_186768 [Dentipellis sp. KUC8613]|nr:hypothetical protein DENSPDRAFT_186768 [Dentipellis sp. KUC8613]
MNVCTQYIHRTYYAYTGPGADRSIICSIQMQKSKRAVKCSMYFCGLIAAGHSAPAARNATRTMVTRSVAARPLRPLILTRTSTDRDSLITNQWAARLRVLELEANQQPPPLLTLRAPALPCLARPTATSHLPRAGQSRRVLSLGGPETRPTPASMHPYVHASTCTSTRPCLLSASPALAHCLRPCLSGIQRPASRPECIQGSDVDIGPGPYLDLSRVQCECECQHRVAVPCNRGSGLRAQATSTGMEMARGRGQRDGRACMDIYSLACRREHYSWLPVGAAQQLGSRHLRLRQLQCQLPLAGRPRMMMRPTYDPRGHIASCTPDSARCGR